MATNTELKEQIDTNIINKTLPQSVTRNNVGNSIKNVIDYVDQEKRPYKIYTAVLNQVGTAAPTVLVLENTIGPIIWSYLGVGNYLATLSGDNVFTVNKTFTSPDRTIIRKSPSTEFYGVSLQRFNDTILRLYSNSDFNPIDNTIVDLNVEIRVYN
jgi:hypothetical protein